MADGRPSQRELDAAKKAARQEAMDDAVADGRLVIRQMTPQERDESDARSAAAAKRRATGQGRR
jgi:signal recognition particle GTPase